MKHVFRRTCIIFCVSATSDYQEDEKKTVFECNSFGHACSMTNSDEGTMQFGFGKIFGIQKVEFEGILNYSLKIQLCRIILVG